MLTCNGVLSKNEELPISSIHENDPVLPAAVTEKVPTKGNKPKPTSKPNKPNKTNKTETITIIVLCSLLGVSFLGLALFYGLRRCKKKVREAEEDEVEEVSVTEEKLKDEE